MRTWNMSKGLYFTKVDIRCKGLQRLRVLDEFMDVLKHEYPHLYKIWHNKISNYIRNRSENV